MCLYYATIHGGGNVIKVNEGQIRKYATLPVALLLTWKDKKNIPSSWTAARVFQGRSEDPNMPLVYSLFLPIPPIAPIHSHLPSSSSSAAATARRRHDVLHSLGYASSRLLHACAAWHCHSSGSEHNCKLIVKHLEINIIFLNDRNYLL